VKATSSTGRASVSKTECWGFESLVACQILKENGSLGCLFCFQGMLMSVNGKTSVSDIIKWAIAVLLVVAAVVGNYWYADQAFVYWAWFCLL
jgi:hypothetical protein